MKEIHYAIAPFYYGICGTAVALIFILGQWAETMGEPSRLGMMDYWLFFLIGGTSALGALFKSLAFHYEKVTTLSLFKYSNLFYSLAADVIIFNSHIYMGEIVGATLIIVSNCLIVALKCAKVI